MHPATRILQSATLPPFNFPHSTVPSSIVNRPSSFGIQSSTLSRCNEPSTVPRPPSTAPHSFLNKINSNNEKRIRHPVKKTKNSASFAYLAPFAVKKGPKTMKSTPYLTPNLQFSIFNIQPPPIRSSNEKRILTLILFLTLEYNREMFAPTQSVIPLRSNHHNDYPDW